MVWMLSHKRVQSFRKVREEETDLLIEKIREALSSSSLINFSDMFMLLTNDVVCRVALGRKYSVGDVNRKIKVLLKEFGELLDVFNVGDCIPWLGWVNCINGLDAKVEIVAKESDEYLETILQEHMNQEKGVISCYSESVEGKEMDFMRKRNSVVKYPSKPPVE
ncbi:unnamed protein product [Ilex paraguariensis]|uniref:Cytochrome P450 n=1 Tax=Ilex paraguariensis TaxID=185542 RepID=A0ABC8S2G3_9AQUA